MSYSNFSYEELKQLERVKSNQILELAEILNKQGLDYASNSKINDLNNELMEIIKAQKNKTNEGCYLATAVYNNYNCEQVIQLRIFRDNILSTTLAAL